VAKRRPFQAALFAAFGSDEAPILAPSQQAFEVGRTIYAVGADHRLYKQELQDLGTETSWKLAASGHFKSLAADGAMLYTVGEDDGRVYAQSVLNMSLEAEWRVSSAGDVEWIALSGDPADTIYKVGADRRIYRQSLRNMTASSPWAGPFCAGARVKSIAVAGDTLFGVGLDDEVHLQALSALGSSNKWGGSIALDASISSFTIAGSNVYGVGVDGKVYRQVATSKWELAARGPMRDVAIGQSAARWLKNDPTWSRSGGDDVGLWASTIADDNWGTPASEGPANLLGGGRWRTRWHDIRDQWFVLDLGRAMSVAAVRVQGAVGEPGKSPRGLRLQFAWGLLGPWSDAVSFEGAKEAWATAWLPMATMSRYWRLYVNDTWGSGGEGEDMCIVSGFALAAAPSPNVPQVTPVAASPRAQAGGGCHERFVVPPKPVKATDYNGLELAPVCLNRTQGPHHVFIIGDWGGIVDKEGQPPKPADHRGDLFPEQQRPFIVGVDDAAQLRVAREMAARAPSSRPDYILNVGDNFYWGGVEALCGARLGTERTRTGQWRAIFEEIYRGPGLDWVQWLGVLGNHDYGGFTFTSGWDQTIAYTWETEEPSTGRWVTPALYWRSKVHYADFSVDYFFLDSNVYDAFEPDEFTGHNLCSVEHNPADATCAPQGPSSVADCPHWFRDIWTTQNTWLVNGLTTSSADWQILITHFPPTWGKEYWIPLTRQFGVDLIISGHRHHQELHAPNDEGNVLGPTPFLITGGGGGITSQETPSEDGEDDQYGFMDMTLTSETLKIEAISHGGQLRKTIEFGPRYPEVPLAWAASVSEPGLQTRRRATTRQSVVAEAPSVRSLRQQTQASGDSRGLEGRWQVDESLRSTSA